MNMPRFAVAFLCSICAVDRMAPAPAAVFSIALIRHNKELFMDIRRFLLAAILFSATLFAAPQPKPPVSGAWRLVFAEEFNGTNLNPKVWMKLRGLGRATVNPTTRIWTILPSMRAIPRSATGCCGFTGKRRRLRSKAPLTRTPRASPPPPPALISATA